MKKHLMISVFALMSFGNNLIASEAPSTSSNAEVVRLQQRIEWMTGEFQKHDALIQQLAGQLAKVINGETRIEILRVGKVQMDHAFIAADSEGFMFAHVTGLKMYMGQTYGTGISLPNGHSLDIQTDGNLVLRNGNQAIWTSGTNGR